MRGVCSGPYRFEFQDNGVAIPVQAAATLTLSATSINAYSDASCTMGTSTLPVPAGQSGASFYVNTTIASFSGGKVTATTPVAGSNLSAQLTVTIYEQVTLSMTATNNTLPAGSCVAVQVLATNSFFSTSPVPTDTPVAVSAVPANNVAFYSDADCTTALGNGRVTIAANTASTVVYVKLINSGPTTVSGTSTIGSAQVTVTSYPAVRRGSCRMGAAATSLNCDINPAQVDVNHTLVIAQVRGANIALPGQAVICRLATARTITCERISGTGEVNIGWQTLELANGLTVQHLDGVACSAAPVPLVFDPASTFVVKQSEGVATTGPQFGNPFVTPFVLDPAGSSGGFVNSVSAGGLCDHATVEVVQLTGLTVSRGVTTLPAGSRNATVTLPAATKPIVSVQVNTDASSMSINGAAMCDWFVRGATTATGATFTRGASANGPVCSTVPLNVYFERIDFGARASQVVQTAVGLTTALQQPVSTTGLDLSRTLFLTSSQITGGPGAGETESSTTNDLIGDALGSLELVGGGLSLMRGASANPATFTVFSVEVMP